MTNKDQLHITPENVTNLTPKELNCVIQEIRRRKELAETLEDDFDDDFEYFYEDEKTHHLSDDADTPKLEVEATQSPKGPRLLAAAKEFNMGRETIIEFLEEKGFDMRLYRNPSSKLTEAMYQTLQERNNSLTPREKDPLLNTFKEFGEFQKIKDKTKDK